MWLTVWVQDGLHYGLNLKCYSLQKTLNHKTDRCQTLIPQRYNLTKLFVVEEVNVDHCTPVCAAGFVPTLSTLQLGISITASEGRWGEVYNC